MFATVFLLAAGGSLPGQVATSSKCRDFIFGPEAPFQHHSLSASQVGVVVLASEEPLAELASPTTIRLMNRLRAKGVRIQVGSSKEKVAPALGARRERLTIVVRPHGRVDARSDEAMRSAVQSLTARSNSFVISYSGSSTSTAPESYGDEQDLSFDIEALFRDLDADLTSNSKLGDAALISLRTASRLYRGRAYVVPEYWIQGNRLRGVLLRPTRFPARLRCDAKIQSEGEVGRIATAFDDFNFEVDTDGLSKSVLTIQTTQGPLQLRFYSKDAPLTVRRFLELAGSGFYDWLVFHRVVPGFVVQGGDPRADGTGGSGLRLRAEFNKRKHVDGTVAMARAEDVDSADSQFYISLGTHPHLDRMNTVFGKVVCGIDTAHAIRVCDGILRTYVDGP